MPSSHSIPEKTIIFPFSPAGDCSAMSASETGRSAPIASPTSTTPANSIAATPAVASRAVPTANSSSVTV